MKEESSGYKSAFKATTLFGGVQVFRILINMLKFKLIAVILGPAGFGLIGIYNSIVTFVQSTTSFGLSSSAVRDISLDEVGNREKTVTALYKWFVGTGIVGTVLMVLLSPLISKWSFENYNYITPIILLSISVFFLTVNSGELAILQGYRKMKDLAKVNVLGALIGLLVSLPIFLIWKDDGIVPSLIVSAILMFLLSNYHVRKLKVNYEKQSLKESYQIGKKTLYLGLMLSLSAILVSLVELVVKSYITRVSGTSDVGFYQAGWTINTSYIGLVLTAMSTDYFPRLSTIVNDPKEVQKTVSEQTEIALIILAPLVTVLLTILPLFVIILYSKEFLLIIPMTMIMLVGALFKTVSWAISYIFLAKGDGKNFFYNELIISVIIGITSIVFYKYFKLIGIGIAFSINYFLYFLLVYFRAYRNYNFKFSKQFWTLMIKYVLLVVLSYTTMYVIGYNLKGYIAGSAIALIALFVAYRDMNERIEINKFIKKILKK